MAPICYWWGGMWIVPAVMMLVMLTFTFFILRRLSHGERGIDHFCKPWDRNESALEILKKRYAAGVISREEFEKMREEIR